MKKLFLIAALGICATGTAFAQNIDKNSACWQGLAKEYNALLADRKTDATNINKAEAAAFETKLNTLKADWTKSQQGGVTQQECTAQRASISNLQKELDKMQAAPVVAVKPAAPEDLKGCRVDLDKEYKALVADHAAGLKAKKMSKKEEEDYQKTMTALKTKWTEALKDGASVKECTDQRAAIKTAQAELNEMQAVNGKVHVCFDEFKKTAKETDDIVAKGKTAKKISDKEAEAYKKRDAHLDAGLKKAMSNDKLSQKECDGLLIEAKKEKAWATKAAAA
jgi:hypothetical protein